MGVCFRGGEGRVGEGRVLIVDDDPMTRLIYSKFLQDAGVDVVCVDSGRAALEELRVQAFDLVLLDNVMPELTGLQLPELLPSQELAAVPRIFVSSATSDPEMVVRCTQLGADGVLVKPVPPAALRALVQPILET